MKKKLIVFIGLFYFLALNSFNDSYDGDDAEGCFETNFMKHCLIKEDYIKYFPHYKRWKEDFSNVDVSKIDLKKLPFPYSILKTILPFDYRGWKW